MKKILIFVVAIWFVGIIGVKAVNADCNSSATMHSNFAFDKTSAPNCEDACKNNGGVVFSDDPTRADTWKCNFNAGCVDDAKNRSEFTAADSLCMAACEQFGGRLEGDYPLRCSFSSSPSTEGSLAENSPCKANSECKNSDVIGCLTAADGKYDYVASAANGKQGYCLPDSLVGTPARTTFSGELILPSSNSANPAPVPTSNSIQNSDSTPTSGSTQDSTSAPVSTSGSNQNSTSTQNSTSPKSGSAPASTVGSGAAQKGSFGEVIFAPSNNAAGGLVPCGNGKSDPCTLCHFIIGFRNLVNFMLKLVVTMGFVGIFASGVMYMISAGDDKMMGSAKSALTASLVGFGIVMGAWLIVNVTIWALGANIGVATGQNWYDFNCSARSSALPSSAPVVTAQNCCIMGAGSCSHINASSECQGGTYKAGACSNFPICTPGAVCKALNQTCTINAECCAGTVCTDMNDTKTCRQPMACRTVGQSCVLNGASQTQCCANSTCRVTNSDPENYTTKCVANN